jgi:hypothetical protein
VKLISPLIRNKSVSPIKPIIIPTTLYQRIPDLKNNKPVMIVKIGVHALRMPVNALSIFVSARQNRNAGMKLPSNPEIMINVSLFTGTCRTLFIATGIRKIPALNSRSAATW